MKYVESNRHIASGFFYDAFANKKNSEFPSDTVVSSESSEHFGKTFPNGD